MDLNQVPEEPFHNHALARCVYNDDLQCDMIDIVHYINSVMRAYAYSLGVLKYSL